MKTKTTKARCGYTELVFSVGDSEFVLSRDYKDGQPLLYWFVIRLGGEPVTFDIRTMGIDEDEFALFVLMSNTVEILRKVRDFLISIDNFVGKLQEVAWRPAGSVAQRLVHAEAK